MIDWLIREEQKELFDFVFGCALNLLFLALSAILLWPLGRTAMALDHAKGSALFWVTTTALSMLLFFLQDRFDVELYSRYNAFVLSNLLVGGLLQGGWSAFAALTVHRFAAGEPLWMGLVLFLIGLLSCYVAFNVLCSFYRGQLYRLANLLTGLVTFVLFILWPPAARVLFGWYSDLF